jgi:heme/copper-type cytochrome/quinol oxidase subunit 3
MLGFVLGLPRHEPALTPPHRAYHAAALYWHFVDALWVLIVALLYVTPHLRT